MGAELEFRGCVDARNFAVYFVTLHVMLHKACNLGWISGLAKTESNQAGVTNLQYADDTILFPEANEGQLAILRLILLLFEGITGLSINYHKSHMYPLNVDAADATRWAMAMGCQVMELPITYLGVPIRGGTPRRAD
jgi:hypothetical protein